MLIIFFAMPIEKRIVGLASYCGNLHFLGSPISTFMENFTPSKLPAFSSRVAMWRGAAFARLNASKKRCVTNSNEDGSTRERSAFATTAN